MTENKEESDNFEANFDISQIDKLLDDPEFQPDDPENENIQDFTPQEYLKWQEQKTKELDKEYLEFETQPQRTFDDIVDKYKILINLYGESYTNITKMIFYSLIGNQIKFNQFSMNATLLDTRMPLLIMIKAGHGKKNYENFIKRTINGIGRTYCEPTSYHPEQFVGKVNTHERDGEIVYEKVPGFLSNDYVLIDEAYSLLMKKENDECLTYIRTALDPIGSNTITKKQVAIPEAHRLEYDPNCTITLLTQYISNVNEELLSRGSFRRFVILNSRIKAEERNDARRMSEFLTMDQDLHTKIWNSWIAYNKVISSYKLKFVGKQEDFEIIDDYLDKIYKIAEKRGKEVLELFETAQFTIKQTIFKMSIIRAVIEHDYRTGENVTIKKNHINGAISDYNKVWEPMIGWVAQQMQIKRDEPIGWSDRHNTIVEILKDHGTVMLMLDLVTIYAEKFQSSNKKIETLKTDCYRKIDKLYKWGIIKKENTGDSTGKRIKLVS